MPVDIEAGVRDYYGKTLKSGADLKTDACCSPASLPRPVREGLPTEQFLQRLDDPATASRIRAYAEERAALYRAACVALVAEVVTDSQRARLPADILDGPKTGFGVPYEHWIRTSLHDLARDAILEPGFLTRFGFNRAAVAQALVAVEESRAREGAALQRLLDERLAAGAANDAGGWQYNNVSTDPDFGTLWVNCTHTDTKGSAWTSY